MTLRVLKDVTISKEEINSIMENLERRTAELVKDINSIPTKLDAIELSTVIQRSTFLKNLVTMKSNLTTEDMVIE